MWFTEGLGGRIAKIHTDFSGFTEYTVPTAFSLPGYITVGSDGNLWFGEAIGNKIGRITTSGVVTEFTIPTASAEPIAVTLGPDGNIWFAENTGNNIGRITPAGAITEFPIPTAGSGPIGIIAQYGNLWFTEGNNAGNKIGEITPAGAITEFPLPTAGAGASGIWPGPDGNLWFTESSLAEIGVAQYAAASLQVSAPATGLTGVPFNVTVTALNAFGAPAQSYAGTVHFTSSSAGTLPGDYTFTAADAGVHTFSVTLVTPGVQSITATDMLNSMVTGTATINLTATQAASLTMTAPGTAVAGVPFSLTVTALDSSGHQDVNYTGTVKFTSSDPTAVLPAPYTFTAADAGIHTFTGVVLKTSGNRTITVKDQADSTLTAMSSINVIANTVTHLVCTAPLNTTAGVPFSLTVISLDAFNNQGKAYRGTVTFSSSDSAAVLPGNYTFTAADNGSHTFINGVTLNTLGNQLVTAKDVAHSTITGAASVNVVQSPVTLFVVSAPTTVIAGVGFKVTVTAQDQNHHTVANYTGTVHFTPSAGSLATVPPDYTFATADNGVHTFTGVIFRIAGGRALTVNDTVNTTVTGQAAFTVVANSAAKFLVTASTANPIAGTPFHITVTAQDQFGNTATNYHGTVTFSSTDTAAVLPGNYTFTATDKGRHVFVVTLNTLGSQTITATDTTTGTITGKVTVTVKAQANWVGKGSEGDVLSPAGLDWLFTDAVVIGGKGARSRGSQP
jgi:hypothetical protein